MDSGEDPQELLRVASANGHDLYNSESEERMCEAYVMLGRVNHVKMRHQRDTKKLQAVLEERVQSAFDAATKRVCGEYDSLKETLERLYKKSIADLEGHKAIVEEPTQDCLKVLHRHLAAVSRAEEGLKAVLSEPDEDRLVKELPAVMADVTAIMSTSAGLEGLQFPKASRLSPGDFPAGRLHNLVIAPKRSGDRGRKSSTICSEETSKSFSVEPAAVNRAPFSTVKRPPLDAWEDIHAPAKGSAAAGVKAGAQNSGDDYPRNKRVPLHSTAEVECQAGDQGTRGLPKDGEACGHCACACRSDDVWAAYRTLRTRYRELKERADREEMRGKVEENRASMQEEFDRKCQQMEKELHGAKAEAQRLQGIVQDSIAECKARQRDSIEMRGQVLQAQKRLEEALRDALSSREEINRRKRYGEELLARLRQLQKQTVACANSVGAAGFFTFSTDGLEYTEKNDEDGVGVKASIRQSASGRASGSRASIDTDIDTDTGSDTDVSSSEAHWERRERGTTRGSSGSRDGRTRAREEQKVLAREREYLSREVHRLSARLSKSISMASGDDDDDASLDDSDDDSVDTTSSSTSRSSTHARVNTISSSTGRPSAHAHGYRENAHNSTANSWRHGRRHSDISPGASRHSSPRDSGGAAGGGSKSVGHRTPFRSRRQQVVEERPARSPSPNVEQRPSNPEPPSGVRRPGRWTPQRSRLKDTIRIFPRALTRKRSENGIRV